MIVDGFRSSLQFYCEVIEDGAVDVLLLVSMDRKLCDVANHIAFCHRLYAEKRLEAGQLRAILLMRQVRLREEARHADRMLEATLEIQDQLIALRASVVIRLFEKAYDLGGKVAATEAELKVLPSESACPGC